MEWSVRWIWTPFLVRFVFDKRWIAIKDTIKVQEFNANLNTLKKLSALYKSINESKKYRPDMWVQFCVERMISFAEELNG